MRRLNIGSGEHTPALKADGWVTLDADPRWQPDILAKLPPMPELVMNGAGAWDCIEMIHVIEHFYLRDALLILDSCFEALKAGGTLIIEAPDIEKAAAYLLGLQQKDEARRSEWAFYDMFAFYGDQRRANPLYQHLWGWSPRSMEDACRDVGFNQIGHEDARHHWPWRDFRVVATK